MLTKRTASFKPVQSTVSLMKSASKNPFNYPVSLVRDEPEKVFSFKAKKKVTFDPNVKIYEYVSRDEASDFYLESEGSGKKGGGGKYSKIKLV
jgi:hypothetical protein